MSILDVINELQSFGYFFCLDGEIVRYKHLAKTDPPKERVTPLLETLKKNKGEVIELLRQEKAINKTLQDLYLETFNRVGWKTGIGSFTEVKQIEDRLNEVWINAMEGKATLEDFKNILAEWEGTIRETINR